MKGLRAKSLLCCALFAASAIAQETPESAAKTPADLVLAQDPPTVVPRVLEQAQADNTVVVVSLGRQRVSLHVDKEVAIDAPISSGKRRGQTPTGEFQVTAKSATHQSNLYGDFVDREGNPVRHGVSTRIDAAPSGAVFRPEEVRYYMKLNDEGLALHAGRLPGYPASDTAVRLPADIAPLIFHRVQEGTLVRVEE